MNGIIMGGRRVRPPGMDLTRLPARLPAAPISRAKRRGSLRSILTKNGAMSIFLKLLVLFTIVPVAELALLIEVGTLIGTAETVALVILTAVVGAWLVRIEGLGVIRRFQRSVAEGRFPAEEMLDGALILVAGAVLVTPGLLTDLLGFFLVTPAGRKVVKSALKRYLEASFVWGPGPR